MPHQGASINIGQHRDFEFFQILVSHLLRAPVGAHARKFAHDQPFDIRPGSLVVFRIGAVIPDFRIGQDNDLAGVRRVGENFLVAGDGSIENNFAVTFCFCSVTFAAEDSAIFQRKDGLHSRSGEWIL